jgi:hypothetical protein
VAQYLATVDLYYGGQLYRAEALPGDIGLSMNFLSAVQN